MDDFHKVLTLFKELGIEHKIESIEDDSCDCPYAIHLVVDTAKLDSKISGYNGFGNTYFFNKHGKFVKLNIWE